MSKHQCVGALIVQRENILLGLRSPTRAFYPNVWDIFGGHVEDCEQPEQSLVRELQEELGITPLQWKYIETLRLAWNGDEEIHCRIYLVFEWSGVPINLQPDEHSMIRWFSIDQAVQLSLADPSYSGIFVRVL